MSAENAPEYTKEQEAKLNQVLEISPESEKTDQKRMEFWSKTAELFADSESSLEQLRTSKEMDNRRMAWWEEQANKNETKEKNAQT
jgi:hypothetical protein